jgi:hypothetical protein
MKVRNGHPLTVLTVALSAWVAGRALILTSDAAAKNGVGQPSRQMDMTESVTASPYAQVALEQSPAGPIKGSVDDPLAWQVYHTEFTPAFERAPRTHIVQRLRPDEPRRDPATALIMRSSPVLAQSKSTSELPSEVRDTTDRRSDYAAPAARPLALANIGAPLSPRLSISTWTLWRPSVTPGGSVLNGQLGGSQAGARVSFRFAQMSHGRSAHVYWRVSTPLSQRAGQENAVGVSVKLGSKIPFEFGAERRFGPRNAWASLVSGGISGKSIGNGLKLDGYAQAGLVGIKAPIAFADGEVVISRAVRAPLVGPVDFGIGIWGGAQPSLSRVDVGPAMTVHPSIAGRRFRLSAQWRARVAGNANPASGPAVTLGADF